MCYICAMNVQNDRSYAKESTKTSPSGVRFDKEQLEFIQNKEPKLTTKQKVVDFLLNKFWWENKVSKPSHKGLPPDEIVTVLHDAFDGKKTDRVKYDEAGMFSEQKSIPLKTVAQWIAEKRELESEEEFSNWEVKLDADPFLTNNQKKLIKIA